MNEIKKIPDSPVCYIKGVGEKRAKLLEKLGITTALQLAEHYPRGYIDFNETTAISNLVNDGENHVVKAIVTKKFPAYYGRINIFKVLVSDGTGDMLITFFNSDYSFTRLKLDNEYCFYGKMAGDFLRKEMNSPVFIDSQDPNKLMPRYSLTTGISQGIMSNCIKNVLRDFTFPEHLSDTLMDKYNLISYDNALRWIHFPENKEQYDKAKYRLTFEELFLLQLGLKSMKNRKKRLAGAPMESKSIDEYYSSLPFTLTGAQIRAISECCDDMQKSVPMNRLLQGDVGSGKTAVAIVGTISGVLISALFAFLFCKMTDISGYNVSSIESLIYVRDQTGIDVGQLLFAGILIASLGAVMDVAMSISSTIEEISHQNPELEVKGLFFSGMRVGKDMMGTMSNTLILAFAGGSLNTLVFIFAYNYSYHQIINMYSIGIELMQGISASMGVILTVPFTSLAGAFFISGKVLKKLFSQEGS